MTKLTGSPGTVSKRAECLDQTLSFRHVNAGFNLAVLLVVMFEEELATEEEAFFSRSLGGISNKAKQ